MNSAHQTLLNLLHERNDPSLVLSVSTGCGNKWTAMLRKGPTTSVQWCHFAFGPSHEDACYNLVEKMRMNGALV